MILALLDSTIIETEELNQHKVYFPFYDKNPRFSYKITNTQITINLFPQSLEEQSKVKKWYHDYSHSISMQKKHDNIIMYETAPLNELTSSYSCTFKIHEGNLTKYLKSSENNTKSIPEHEIQKFVKSILNGVFILYTKRKIKTIILTPDNIFLGKKEQKNNILPTPIISFFSPSLLLTKSLDMENFFYFPPELLNNKNNINEISSSSLLWMLGVICFKLMFDVLPFGDEHSEMSKEEFIKILNKGEYIIPLKNPISYEFLIFVATLLQANPSKRENFEEVKMMAFLNGKPQKFQKVKVEENGKKELKLNIYRNTELLIFLYERISDKEWNQNFEGKQTELFCQDQSSLSFKLDTTMNNSLENTAQAYLNY